MTVAFLLVVVASCGGDGDSTSSSPAPQEPSSAASGEAYCEQVAAVQAEAETAAARVDAGSDPAKPFETLLLTGVEISRIVTLVGELEEVAPAEIQDDWAAVNRAFAGLEVSTDPVQLLSDGVIATLQAAGPMEAIDRYTSETCGSVVFAFTDPADLPALPGSDDFDGPGIVVASCDGSVVTLALVDDQSGELVATRVFNPLSGDAEPTLTCLEERPFGARQRFNSDYTRMTITTSGRLGNSHVGYLDYGTGEVVDLSAMRDGGGDFDEDPADFLPYYTDGDQFVAVSQPELDVVRVFDEDTGASEPFRGVGVANNFAGFAPGPASWIIPVADVDGPRDANLPNPSGEIALRSGRVSSDIAGDILRRPTAPDDPSTVEDDEGDTVGRSEFCYPWSWVDDTSYLCDLDDTVAVVRLVGSIPTAPAPETGGTPDPPDVATEITTVAPDSQGRINWSALASPDRSRVAFLSRLNSMSNSSGEGPVLYVAPIDGSSSPQRLNAVALDELGLPAPLVILEWR